MSIYSPVVACSEEHVSYSENFTLEDWSASVVLRCAWASRHALVADIVGNRRAWPHSGYGVVPLAQSAAVKPDGAAYIEVGQACSYSDALVTINYGTKQLDLVAESLEPQVEFRTLDYRQFRWGAGDGDPLIEAEAPGKLIRGLSLVRTHYHLSSIHASILTLPGSCNDAAYASTLLGLTFDEETLLFAPGPMNRTITTAGSKGWNVQLKFMFKASGWNKFWRAKTEDWEEIYQVGEADAYKNYPPDDFSAWLY